MINGPMRTTFNFGWNLAGIALPALASLAAIPPTVRMLGTERFGLLILCWLLVTYLVLFDLGLTRALTRFASERLGAGRPEDLPGLFATSMSMMTRLAVIGAVVAALLSPLLVNEWLQIPGHLRSEALWSFWMMSASLPFMIVSGGWRALLEVHGRFDVANKLQIPIGVASALAPVAALVIADSLVAVTALLLAIRIAGWAAHRRVTLNLLPALATAKPDHAIWRRPLLGFGGWATVSGVLSPVMVYFDRFLIGGLVSLTALAYYSASYELVTRAWMLAGAAIGVLFPALSTLLAADPGLARNSYRQALAGVFALVLAPLAVLSLLAPEILRLWLDADFAVHGSDVLRILAAGVLINCLAQVSQAVVHAGGRTDWTAKLHLTELAPYLLLLWWLASLWGIAGIAVAWTLRVALDAMAMTLLANRILPESGNRLLGYTSMVCAATLAVAGMSQFESVTVRGIVAIAIVIVCAMIAMRVHREAASRPTSIAKVPS